MPEAATPTPAPAERTSYNRGRRGPTLKFLGSLRGDGALLAAAGETPVSYQLDIYQSGADRTGSGSLEGAMPDVPDDGDMAARLRLSNGREIAVTLQGVDPGGASFEARGALPVPD